MDGLCRRGKVHHMMFEFWHCVGVKTMTMPWHHISDISDIYLKSATAAVLHVHGRPRSTLRLDTLQTFYIISTQSPLGTLSLHPVCTLFGLTEGENTQDSLFLRQHHSWYVLSSPCGNVKHSVWADGDRLHIWPVNWSLLFLYLSTALVIFLIITIWEKKSFLISMLFFLVGKHSHLCEKRMEFLYIVHQEILVNGKLNN